MRHLVLAYALVACGGSAVPQPHPPTDPKPPGSQVAPYTMVVVYSGWEMWIGNDKVSKLPDDDPSKTPGALLAIEAAFDKLDLAHTAPPGSQVIAISYADKPVVRLPMGPMSAFSGSVFGTQDDYYGNTGVEMVRALELASVELGKATTGKKVIVVIGDGVDTNLDAAHTELPKLKQELAAKHVDVVGFVYKARYSNEQNAVKWLTDDVHVVSTLDGFDIQLAHALERYQR